MIVFDSLIVVLAIVCVGNFFHSHPYSNGVLTLAIVSIMTTSFWLPTRWFKQSEAAPFVGEYDASKGDTTFIYYGTWSQESLQKRNDYIRNNKDRIIKCISIDKWKSLYEEDLKTLSKDVVSDFQPSLYENWNMKYTIYEYTGGVLMNCY